MKTVTTLLSCVALSAALLWFPAAPAEDQKFGLDTSSIKVQVSSNQFSSKDEELIAYLQTVLKEYFVISKDDWTHKYTHVADGDSTGTIEWAGDSPKIWKWMVRPGRLATVTDEKGNTFYLAKVGN